MSYPRRRTDVNSRVVEEEAVVLDRQHGFIHQLNVTATYIWERCEGNASIEDIAAQLREEAGVEDVFIISGATGAGVPALLDAVLPLLAEAQTAEDAPDEEGDTPWSPI